LLGMLSMPWTTLPALFGLVIFQVWCHFCLGPVPDHDLPTYSLPHSYRYTTGASHHVQLIDWYGVLITFCPEWSQAVILSNSAFLEVEITDVTLSCPQHQSLFDSRISGSVNGVISVI
jgi:hypothetical protein